ncbi:MAG: thiamine-phosphate kinase [Thiotrichales bacterium]|nr:thiamine-phosphate kinase [Thiotrichales bacterium]
MPVPSPEFDLIAQYFSKLGHNELVQLGVGDDAAITTVPVDCELVTTVDTLIAGVHFFPDAEPASIAYKALAVNLSDLAAMAAKPTWFTLSLTLPEIDKVWLAEFSRGLSELALEHGIALIGGDTVRGPLSITIQACGLVEQGQALRRDGAKVGDGIFVTGSLGDACLALAFIKGENSIDSVNQSIICEKLHCPIPRVKAGLNLSHFANSAIDISDGLAADLSHILTKSGVGAELLLKSIPLSDAMRNSVSEDDGYKMAFYGGDDYELCFTVPKNKSDAMLAHLEAENCSVYRIGTIIEEKGLWCIGAGGERESVESRGYDHFS